VKEYRKASLEKLTSPDQLNQRLQVVTFRGWIGLLVMAILVVAILFWAFLGSIPVIVEGRGVFFDPNKTVLVRSEIQGTVSRIFVRSGDFVEQGTELMALKNHDISTDLFEKQILITSLENYLETNPKLPANEQDDIRRQIVSEKAKIESLRFSREKETIIAPEKGTIVNLNISSEGSVQPGTMLVWMTTPRASNEQQKIYAVFPFEVGEKIKENMFAEMAVASVEREKYGLLFGRVTKIYPYFTSFEQGPLIQLPSKNVIDFLTKGIQGGVIVEIQPNPDPNTITRYQWSSKKGPPFQIDEGSSCIVKVVLENRKPISFLIPQKAED